MASDLHMANVLKSAYSQLEPRSDIAAVAYAMGVITTVARYLTPDPVPFVEILKEINEEAFDQWAQEHDEPSFTTTELEVFRRFLESLFRSKERLR